LGKRKKAVRIHGNRTSDFNGVAAVRQGLFVTLKNKLQKSVKVLFPVMGFGVSRSQTAETCNTGGVFQDPVCVQFT
jgi:iron-sulfur cluster repair protein YtfE (RIC family)